MDKVLGIKFSSKIIPVKPVNEQFTLCKCYVMAIGKNQNKSNILKEAVDDAMPSLFNIPVVGHLYVDDKGEYRMGGHDVTLKQNENGKYEIELTVTTLTNYSDDISILVYNSDDSKWEVVKPKSVDYKNKKIVIEVSDLYAIGIYAKVAASKPEGTAPSTENTSSVWMIWVAMAVVAMGAGVVVSQKKRR